jgi:hypothetical protein
MEPHLLPATIGSRVNVKNDYRVRRRMEALGFWPEYVTPLVVTYRRDFSNGALCTFGYDPITDTEAKTA